MRWDVHSLTDKGERELNEDSIELIQEDNFLCALLCDGLGGHEGGELASQCVCASVKDTLSSCDKTLPLREIIENAVEKAQEALLNEQIERNKTGAMKTTLCCLIFRGEEAAAAWVGDSRIYQFRAGRLLGHTPDHSIPQYLVNAGEITESQIRRHPDRNKLLRVMGSHWDTPRYQFWELEQPQPGDAFLLCSDGLWDWIDERHMTRKLRFSRSSEGWLLSMVNTVLRNGRGKGMDNYSAIAIRIR